MNIDFAAVFISQNKIPWSGILNFYFLVASRFQKGTEPGNIPLLNCYVQVFVRARLFTKECVNAPPTINPNINTQVLQVGIEADYVSGIHMSRSRQLELLRIMSKDTTTRGADLAGKMLSYPEGRKPL